MHNITARRLVLFFFFHIIIRLSHKRDCETFLYWMIENIIKKTNNTRTRKSYESFKKMTSTYTLTDGKNHLIKPYDKCATSVHTMLLCTKNHNFCFRWVLQLKSSMYKNSRTAVILKTKLVKCMSTFCPKCKKLCITKRVLGTCFR